MIWLFAGESCEVTRVYPGLRARQKTLVGGGLGCEDDGTSREHGSHAAQACDR